MLAHDRLIAGPDVGMGNEVDELVGAAATHDALRIEPVSLGDRVAQGRGRPIWIAVQLVDEGLVGCHRQGARAQRRLIGGKLDGCYAAGDAAFAWNVGVDLEDAGLRRWASLCHDSVSSLRSP